MTSQQLSHRGRLPSWHRPGLCRRSGTEVRKLARDQLTPEVSLRGSTEKHSETCQSNSRELARIVQLEKNIIFLKKQHNETLGELHKEVERLRTENRDLNLKLVMCCCGSRMKPVHSRVLKEGSMIGKDDMDSTTSNDELRAVFLEEEVRKLRNKVAIERNKCNRLMKLIERKVLDRQKSSSYDQGSSEQNSLELSMKDHVTPAPTLEECESVIQQLQSKTNQQAHELVQIKADLRDVLYSHKWTPDAFLMARAYISDSTQQQDQQQDHGFLPQIEPQTSRQTLEKAYKRVKEEVTLPALRPKVPCMVAERHRRAQAVRGRIAKPLF